MSNKKSFKDGYQPSSNRGYQPTSPKPSDKGNGSGPVTNGYQPTVSEGSNPTNRPKPPGNE